MIQMMRMKKKGGGSGGISNINTSGSSPNEPSTGNSINDRLIVIFSSLSSIFADILDKVDLYTLSSLIDFILHIFY